MQRGDGGILMIKAIGFSYLGSMEDLGKTSGITEVAVGEG